MHTRSIACVLLHHLHVWTETRLLELKNTFSTWNHFLYFPHLHFLPLLTMHFLGVSNFFIRLMLIVTRGFIFSFFSNVCRSFTIHHTRIYSIAYRTTYCKERNVEYETLALECSLCFVGIHQLYSTNIVSKFRYEYVP